MMKELKKDLGCLCIMTVVSALAIVLSKFKAEAMQYTQH